MYSQEVVRKVTGTDVMCMLLSAACFFSLVRGFSHIPTILPTATALNDISLAFIRTLCLASNQDPLKSAVSSKDSSMLSILHPHEVLIIVKA